MPSSRVDQELRDKERIRRSMIPVTLDQDSISVIDVRDYETVQCRFHTGLLLEISKGLLTELLGAIEENYEDVKEVK